MLIRTTQELQLQPRFRRILTFGDVLDESVQLFRRHWASFALLSAILLVPPGLILVFVSASGGLSTTFLLNDLQGGRLPNTADASRLGTAILSTAALQGLFTLAWTAATVAATHDYLHSDEMGLTSVLARTARRYVAALVASCLYLVAIVLLCIVATLPVIFFPVGILGAIVALVGILVWWLRPTARRTWLKWLVIVATPFGLPTYVGGAWAMCVAAIMLEAHGPIGSLRRSAQLMDGQWFRAVGILTLGGLIVALLQYAPEALVQIPISVSAATRGEIGLSPVEQAFSSAARVVVEVLFASLASIIYTLLFIDLRNRREGTDLAERVSQLETATPLSTTNG